MGAPELSALLWRERECLELLVYKLEVQQLLLSAGRSRWIGHSTREIEAVLSTLREASLARSLEADLLASSWGLAEDATLRSLAEHPDAGAWAELFGAHLRALTELAEQIAELRTTNQQLLRSSQRAAQETLANVWTDAEVVTDRASDAARFLDADL